MECQGFLIVRKPAWQFCNATSSRPIIASNRGELNLSIIGGRGRAMRESCAAAFEELSVYLVGVSGAWPDRNAKGQFLLISMMWDFGYQKGEHEIRGKSNGVCCWLWEFF